MKTIVITGANSGLGLQTVKALAENTNHRLLLGCRDHKKAAIEIDEIKAATGNGQLHIIPLDLASFASVRSFARNVAAAAPVLDALVCNAGLQVPKGTQTSAEGFEKTFAVNHLGHFLLTHLLLPIIHPAHGRVLLTGSGTHFNPPIWQSSLFGIPGAEYKGWQELSSPAGYADYPDGKRGYERYAASKLCVLLFGYGLNRRLQAKGSTVTVNVFDPGLMPGSGLAREASAIERWAWKNVLPVMRIFKGVNSIETSARNFSSLITAEAFNGVTGRYFEAQKAVPSSKDSYNQGFQEDLWKGSETLIGESFNA